MLKMLNAFFKKLMSSPPSPPPPLFLLPQIKELEAPRVPWAGRLKRLGMIFWKCHIQVITDLES